MSKIELKNLWQRHQLYSGVNLFNFAGGVAPYKEILPSELGGALLIPNRVHEVHLSF